MKIGDTLSKQDTTLEGVQVREPDHVQVRYATPIQSDVIGEWFDMAILLAAGWELKRSTNLTPDVLVMAGT